MHLKRILGYVLPAISILFIIESLHAGYGVDLLPTDLFRQSAVRGDARAQVWKAREDYKNGDLESARKRLLVSLQDNPLMPLSYIELSRVYIEKGDHKKAGISLRRAYQLSPHTYENLWQIAILAFRSGNTELGKECLELTSAVFPRKSFSLARNVLSDRKFIMSRMVDDSNIAQYLHFLISDNKAAESVEVWNMIKDRGVEVSDGLYYRYIDFLIRSHMAGMAYDMWTGRFGGADDGLVWNGGFEREITGRGFDWTVKQGKGFTVTYGTAERTEGDYSLKVIFDGEENVDFRHVSKIVPVSPGTEYLFTADMKTGNITTDRGVFWVLDCYPARGMNLVVPSRSGYNGTSDWFESSENFRTPEEECSALRIYLRRLTSKKLDRYIGGTVWIDNVNIRETGFN